MKVIQIVDHLSMGGGVNSFVFDLCYALKGQGCDVSLIGIQNGSEKNPEIDKLRNAGIQVECIGASSKKDAILHYVSKLRKVVATIASGEDTICNLHLKLSVLMGVLATRSLKNVKCVETYHNTYHHYHLQCWACSPFIKKYICVSKTAMEEMHRRFKTPYKKMVAIPNGVSRERIRKIAQADQNNNTNKNVLHIASVGRMSYEKNFMVPVKAFVELCDENTVYTLVGRGPQEQEIEAVASSNPYIYMTGALKREEALHTLAEADIVVMPSLWEGRSILQLEAMALDKPMIISDVPGLREPFDEQPLQENENFRICRFGYLVRTNDERAYVMAIEHFIKHRDRALGIQEYLKKISKENDLSKVAEKYFEVYNCVEKL